MSDSASLFQAVQSGNSDQVKTILQSQPTLVNDSQADGFTPLHLAAKKGDGELIKVLLEHGADINALTPDGCTPMELAIKSGHEAAKWFSL